MGELLKLTHAAKLAGKIVGRSVSRDWIKARVKPVQPLQGGAWYRREAVEAAAESIKDVVPLTEAARLVGINLGTFRKWMAAGHFKAYRVRLDGRAWGFRKQDIPKMLKELEVV